MKKALLIIIGVIVGLFALLCIAAALGEQVLNVVATVYAFAFAVGILLLIASLVGFVHKKLNDLSKKKQAAHPAAQQPQKQENEPTPAPKPQQPIRLPYTHNGLERRYHYSDVDVWMPNAQVLTMPGLEEGATVTLWQEKQNQHDAKAVAVVFGGYIIGYLHKGKLQDMANDWINRGKPVLAMIYSKADTGIKIGLAFYDLPKLQRLLQSNPNPKMYRLTRTGSKAVQEALELCTEGTELDIEEDDNGNYMVTSYMGEIVGYLSAQAVDVVDSYGGPDRCSAFLAQTDIDENLKTKGSIYIFRGN